MPRTKKKASPAASIEREDAVKAAVRAMKEGQSIRKAAKLFGIPYTTLHDHCSGELVYIRNKLHSQVHCSSIPLP